MTLFVVKDDSYNEVKNVGETLELTISKQNSSILQHLCSVVYFPLCFSHLSVTIKTA